MARRYWCAVYNLEPEKEELVDLYRSTNDGKMVWIMLNKIDRYCSNWMHATLWMKLKKELLIQCVELYHQIPQEDEDESKETINAQ